MLKYYSTQKKSLQVFFAGFSYNLAHILPVAFSIQEDIKSGRTEVIGLRIRRIMQRALQMGENPWAILMGTMRLSCAMLFCAIIILIHIQNCAYFSYSLWHTALELYSLPASLLLIAVLASAVLEDWERNLK